MKQTVKPRYRFNLFDAFILLLVLAVITAAVFYFLPARENGERAHITLSLTRVDASFSELLHEGDTVYDTSGTVKLGTIKRVSVSPATLEVTDAQTGKVTEVSYPDGTLNAVTLVLDTENAVAADAGCTVGGVEIIPGKTLAFRTRSFSASASCLNLIFVGDAA